MNYQDAVAYFRACYLADNKELTIRDLFAKSVELLWQIEGDDEVLAGNMVLYPIPDAYATDVAKVLKVYEKEKELLYFSFLLLGHDPQAQLKLAAPVFLFTANLGQDAQGSSVCIERDNPKLNVGVLRLIAEQTDAQTDLSSVVFEELAGLADYGLVDGVFARNFPHTDIAPVLEYPKLHGAEQVASLLKEVFQCKELVLKLVPAAGFFVHNKSGDTLGVLNELADLSAATDFSDPLRALFGTDLPLPKPLPLGDVPAILSAAQHRILESAARFPLSLVVGPPGTGKSYTVAALAIEHLTKGQTVLVVSRTDKAVDVIAHKIKHEFLLPNAVVRAGRSQYLRDLKDSIQSLLSGQSLADCPSKKQISAIAHDVNRLKTCIRKAEVSFLKRAAREKQWGRFLASCPNGQAASIWTRFRKSYIRNRVQNRQYLWALSGQLETDFDTLVSKIRSLVAAKHLARTHQMLKNHRKQLGNLYKALGARTGTKKEEYFGMIDFEVLLGTFPIWLLNMKDIYKALPLQKDLFDLAIIDEATQCDIAACLPIFQRAKRVVVTGDPKQLRHISFLAGAVQGHLMARYNLKASGKDSDFFDYRNQSILDVVADRLVSQQQVSFLNEHFRSVPSIIRFSNEAFYNNSLHIMTQKPAHKALNTGIALRPCQGTRHKDGYNTTEAQNLINEVLSVCMESETLADANCPSIGILSPFRSQVLHLQTVLNTQIPNHFIARHDIVVGTAYEFQGEERDLMYLSFSLDNQASGMAFYHLNKPDVFNVSITRARRYQAVYYSFSIEKLKPESHCYRYLNQVAQHNQTPESPSNSRDAFLLEVQQTLLNDGFTTWPAYHLAGLKIDLLVQKNSHYFGIDLIGYPGEFEDAFTTERYKILRRANLRMMPLPYSDWKLLPNESLAAIQNFAKV